MAVNIAGFPGTLSMTATELTTVASFYADDSKVIQDTFDFYNLEADRTGDISEKSVTYYIEVTTDINASITRHPQGTIVDADGNTTADDTWSLAELTFNSSNQNLTVAYNLPTFTNVVVPIKRYTANIRGDDVSWNYIDVANSGGHIDTSGAQSIPIFDLDLKLSSNTAGNISSVTSAFYDYSGNGFRVEAPEQIALAQLLTLDFSGLYNVTAMPTDAGDINKTRDILSYDISAATLNSNQAITDRHTAVQNLYSGNSIFSDWSITISAQSAAGRPAGDYNALTQYARNKDWGNTQGFAAGDKIVALTGKSFELTMTPGYNKADGTTSNLTDVTLVPTTTIYGVLKQS